MYASLLLANIAQMLLLQNWLAGPIGIVVFVPFYAARRGAEEQMMLERFGDRYREYTKGTGGILPRLSSAGAPLSGSVRATGPPGAVSSEGPGRERLGLDRVAGGVREVLGKA